MYGKRLPHHDWQVLLPLLVLWTLQCTALSIESSSVSGRIMLRDSSLSPHCIGSVAHKCTAALSFVSNGVNLTLISASESTDLCGTGQGKPHTTPQFVALCLMLCDAVRHAITCTSSVAQALKAAAGKVSRHQASGQFEQDGGLQMPFVLKRAIAASTVSNDVTVAHTVIWELTLSFASGCEPCSGQYRVSAKGLAA